MQQQVEFQQPAEVGAVAAAAAAAGNGALGGVLPINMVIPDTELGRAQLLQVASNAAMEKPYQAGSGPLQFVTEAGCFTVLDKLPTNVSQLTGQLVEGTANEYRPWVALGFHNSAAASRQAPKFLRSQPTRHTCSMLEAGQHTAVTVGTAYDPPGIQPPKLLADGLWLSTCSFACKVSVNSGSGRNEVFAAIRVIRHLVLRQRDPSNRHGAPYWREWQQPRTQRTWEVGCVALYEFPGDLLEPVPVKLHPAAQLAVAAAAGQVEAAAPPAVVQPPLDAQLPVMGGQTAGAMMLQLPPPHNPGQGLGVPPAAAPLLQQLMPPLVPQVVQSQNWGQLVHAAAPAPVATTAAAAAAATAAAGGTLALVPSTVSAPGPPGQAELLAADEDPDGFNSFLADLLAGDGPESHTADPSIPLLSPAPPPVPRASAAPGTALPAVVALSAAAAGAAGIPLPMLPGTGMAVAADQANIQNADDSEDDDSLPDLTAPSGTGPNPYRHLLTLQDAEAELQHRLLKLAAGMHGDNSGAVLGELLPRLIWCNWQRQQSGLQLLTVADIAESWFLKRSVLHLLVSTVRVWGVGGDEIPLGLTDTCRQQLLDALCGNGPTLKLLLKRGNRNKATPWFTAAHFCNPAALEWLVGRPELTFRRMLLRTKRDKLFYHIISTRAHNSNSLAERERLRKGMVTVLTALTSRVELWLSKLTPEKLQALKQRVLNTTDQRRMQWQQRQRSRLFAEAAGIGQHAGSPPTPAAAGVLQPTAAAAAAAGLGAAAAVTSAAAVAGSSQQQQQQQGLPTPSLPVAGSSSSTASPGRLNLSDEVRWWLQNYAVFHTEWHSSRAASPPYNGDLLEEMVLALYGFRPRGVHD